MTHRAVIITGSNMGDRGTLLARARELLELHAGKVANASGIYESGPWGAMDFGAGDFLNQVLVLDTDLGPEELLDATQEAERMLGRTEKSSPSGGCRKYASRPIDIDILYYDDMVLRTQRLTVPHPLLARRRFVLEPLVEVLPGHIDPVTGMTAREMLDELNDKGDE